MKWGRKKPSSSPPSSSRPSFTSHVFPYSWLTKFKQMSIGSGDKHGKGKRNSVYTTSSSQCAGGGLGGRFHEDDADAFWRPSFGEDSVVDGKKNRGVQEPVRHDMEEEPEFPPSTCQSCRSDGTELIKEDIQTFRSLVSDARCLRGLPREKEAEIIRTPRNQLGKDKRSKKANQRAFEVKQRRLNGDVAENFLESQSGRTIGMIEREDYKLTADDSRKDYNNSSVNPIDTYFRTTEEDCQFIAQKGNEGNYSAESQNLDWQRLKEIKIEELKAKNEKQRKSEYISRETQRKRPKERSKGRAHSPRTASKVEVCKIKALEDMKKARLKKKKKAKDKIMEEGFLGLESFAVVKSSFDPQKDFRDSIMEMIRENRISQPEELEELLACYLTLNSDVYHDLIIKVFRQVWFDLNDPCSDEELDEHEECFYD